MPDRRLDDLAVDFGHTAGMDAERYARALEVFLIVQPLSESERPAALARACAGDAELREEVESLLSHRADDSLLASRPPASNGNGNGIGTGNQAAVNRVAQIGFYPAGTAKWEAEQNRFLQHRIKVLAVGLNLAVFVALFRFMVLFEAPSKLARWPAAGIVGGWTALLCLSVAAFRLRPSSMRRLRRIEVALMVCAGGVLFSWSYAWLTTGTALVGPHAPEVENLLRHAYWVISEDRSTTHFQVGPTLIGFPLGNNWSVLAGLYGLVIPTSARRGTQVLLSLMFCAGVTIFLAALKNPAFRPLAMGNVLSCFFLMAAFGALTIYINLQLQRLRRAAYDAKQVGQYRLLHLIGKGAMGEVYLAQHWLLRRPCAVKLIRREQAGSQDWLFRFEREVQAMAQLTHPNTVEVYDFGRTEQGSFFYAMEYLPGMTLDALVRAHGPLPAARVVYLLLQVCGALAEAHRKGLIHRDIKPGNIFVCERGGAQDVVKLLDFGIVHLRSEDAEPAAQRKQPSAPRVGGETQTASPLSTSAGQILGTPAYMAPEQVRGPRPDARSDIYSLGCVACFLLTAKPPFEQDTPEGQWSAHLRQPAPRLRDRDPNLPADLDAVIARCLSKDPAARFQQVAELLEALSATLAAGKWDGGKAALWWRAHAPAEASEAGARPMTHQPR